MANKEDKTVVETGDTDEANQQEESTGKGGSSKKLILFGGIGVGAIVIGIAVAMFVVKPMMSDAGDVGGITTEEEGDQHKPTKEKGHKKPKKEKHSSGHGEEASNIFTISDIVVNPAGTGGSRFLSVSFAFELESSESEEVFVDREAIIRDALITILSSKTVAQLTDPKQKEIVRYQIKKRVSKLMSTDELAGVYFTDFVLQ